MSGDPTKPDSLPDSHLSSHDEHTVDETSLPAMTDARESSLLSQIQQARTENRKIDAAKLQLELAAFYLEFSHESLAFEQFQSVKSQLDDLQNLNLTARYHTNIADLYRVRGQIDDFREHATIALDLWNRLGKPKLVALTLANLAAADIESYHPHEALIKIQSALTIFQEQQVLPMVGRLQGDLAAVYTMLGLWSKARLAYEDSLEIARQTGNLMEEGITLGTYALFLATIGDFEPAYHNFLNALSIHTQIGNERFVGVTSGNLANLISVQGHPEEAESYYSQSTQLLTLHEDFLSLAMVNAGHAENLVTLGQFDEAYHLFNSALETFRTTKNERMIGSVECSLGEMLWRQGDRSAAEYISSGVDHLYRVSETIGLILPLVVGIEIALSENDPIMVEEYRSKLVQMTTQCQLPLADAAVQSIHAHVKWQRGEISNDIAAQLCQAALATLRERRVTAGTAYARPIERFCYKLMKAGATIE